MKIPKTIKIGGHLYKIRLEKEIENMGTCSAKSNTIVIEANMSQDQQEATLIHEIFHAMNTTFGSDVLSHSLLDSFSEQMYAVLKENNLLK